MIEGIYDNNQRVVIDDANNAIGVIFAEFMRDYTLLCLVNVKTTFVYDNYTFLSSRGESVVDYILAPLINLSQCVSCKAQTVNDQHDLLRLSLMEIDPNRQTTQLLQQTLNVTLLINVTLCVAHQTIHLPQVQMQCKFYCA